jgi:hypothetical protein
MELKDLVPPIELCRKIPAGEFAGSPFVWVEEWAYDEINGEKVECFIYLELSSGYMVVNPKPTKEVAEEIFNTTGKRPVRAITPAPTTDEILDKCKDIPGVLNPTLWWQGIWKTDCAIDKSGKLSEEFFEDADLENLELAVAEDKSAATAALKLWLKLKGIDHE